MYYCKITPVPFDAMHADDGKLAEYNRDHCRTGPRVQGPRLGANPRIPISFLFSFFCKLYNELIFSQATITKLSAARALYAGCLVAPVAQSTGMHFWPNNSASVHRSPWSLYAGGPRSVYHSGP
jgi:hypothetical protein